MKCNQHRNLNSVVPPTIFPRLHCDAMFVPWLVRKCWSAVDCSGWDIFYYLIIDELDPPRLQQNLSFLLRALIKSYWPMSIKCLSFPWKDKWLERKHVNQQGTVCSRKAAFAWAGAFFPQKPRVAYIPVLKKIWTFKKKSKEREKEWFPFIQFV